MQKLKAAVLTSALMATVGAAALAGAGSAAAYGSATPWAPGGVNQDQNAIGGMAFFDSSGNQITSGSTSSAPFSAYAVGYGVPRTGDTKTTLYFYVPTPGQTPDQWANNEALGGSTSYPNAGAPAPVNGTALPTYTGASTDKSLDTASTDYPNSSSTAGYQNVYELRMYTSGVGRPRSISYNYADISINSSTHTWTEVWSPDQTGTATTSTLGSSSTSVTQGDTVTLTDTVAANSGTATPTGTVQFKDNGTNIGTAVSVDNTGKASTTAQINTGGSNAITAVYSPAALSGFAGSNSNTVTITAATAPATNTATALVVNPTTGPAFSAVTLTATTTPTAATGTVAFFDNGQQIGTAPDSNGSASITYSSFTQGDHPKITATFTPDTTKYNPSTSAAVDFNATAPIGATPDPQPIKVTVAPGSLAITTPYTKSHPLDLGTMALNNTGTMLSASANFGDGSFANYGTSGPDGTGSIQVVDTRSGGNNWTASALASSLSDGAASPTVQDSISGENVGLTNLSGHYIPGNAIQSLSFTNVAAASPAVASNDARSLGLGGSTPHAFASTTTGGDGSVAITGTLTINAPTSTNPGTYAGIVTFTVA